MVLLMVYLMEIFERTLLGCEPGTLDGILLESNNGTKLGSLLLDVSEGAKDGANDIVLDGDLDYILLDAELGTVESDILYFMGWKISFDRDAVDGNLFGYNDIIKLGPLLGTSEGTKDGTEGVLDEDA